MIKTLLRSFLMVIMLLLALLAFMLTPMGLRIGIDIGAKFLPGHLGIQKISGVLLGPITLENVRYQDTHEIITARRLRLDWSPLQLFKKRLVITEFLAVQLHIIAIDPEPKQLDIKSIKKIIRMINNGLHQKIGFLQLMIDDASITQLEFSNPLAKIHSVINDMYLRSIMTSTRWDTQFSAKMNKPSAIAIQFQLNGTPSDYHVRIQAHGLQTQWELSGIGNQQNLTLHTTQHTFLRGNLNLAMQWQNQPQQWVGSMGGSHIDLSLLNPLWPKNVSINSTTSGSNTPDFVTNTFIHIQTPIDTLKIHINHKNTWDMVSTYQSTADLHKANITLTGTSEHHTLTAALDFHKEKIRLHLNGSLNKESWNGLLDQLTISAGKHPQWQLQKPTQITARKKELETTPLCLQTAGRDYICLKGTWTNKKIDAQANMNIAHFNWLTADFPHVTIPQGKLIADLHVEGDIQKPKITGSVHLNQGSIILSRLRITLNKITASLLGDDHSLNITAQAYSQNQPINLQGIIHFEPDLNAQFTINSNNALILNTEEYKATATSHLNAAIKGDSIALTGNIDIPTGSIHPFDFKTTTTLPVNDIVYVGDTVTPTKPFWKIQTDVTINIGKNVDIKAAGVDAKLGGTLHLLQQPNQELFGTGDIIVRKGTYTVYGQTLTITPDSSLNYSHSLLNNPMLNIRASKIIQDNTSLGFYGFSRDSLVVGIELQGTVKSPIISFYSNRARLSQADILSYLLLGYGSSSSNATTTDILLREVSAANITSQGLLGKQNIAAQIQSSLGLSELGMESDTTVDALGNPFGQQSSFVVGKSVTRHVYVRYSVAFLNPSPVNVFELRYLFNKKWAVQTDSSQLGNGADVLYTISRN